MNIEYVWRKTRTKHPEILNPVKTKNNEDRRVEWLTYKNIIDWTARAKEFLLSIQMAKDEPGVICEWHASFVNTHPVAHYCINCFYCTIAILQTL